MRNTPAGGAATSAGQRKPEQLVRIHLNARRAQPHGQDSGDELRVLVTKLVEVSGNPRDACWRFMRQSGIVAKRAYASGPNERSRGYWI